MSWSVDLHQDGYQPSRERTTAKVYVHGDADDAFAAYAAIGGAVAYLLTNGHWLQGIELGPQLGFSDGEWWWEATVTWGVQSSANTTTEPGAVPTLRVSTKGGRQHITQSLETVGQFAAPGQGIWNHNGAIGVTRNGIEGVDIVVPAFSWSLSVRVPSSAVTTAYVLMLEELTGGVNNDTFWGRPAGSVRFDGADLQVRGEETEIEFSFSSERNVEDRTIGDITGIEKEGWDYLWVEYEEEKDTTESVMVQKPIVVRVERVSPRVDLNLLGL